MDLPANGDAINVSLVFTVGLEPDLAAKFLSPLYQIKPSCYLSLTSVFALLYQSLIKLLDYMTILIS